jgi:hypothetical protein
MKKKVNIGKETRVEDEGGKISPATLPLFVKNIPLQTV